MTRRCRVRVFTHLLRWFPLDEVREDTHPTNTTTRAEVYLT